jgi:hypothetical protein
MTYFHPQRMPVLPARRRAAARRQLEELVARPGRSARSARSGRPGRSRRRSLGQRARHKPVVAAIVTAIVLGTGTAAAVVAFRPVTNHSSVRCFSAPRLSGSYYTTVAEPAKGLTRAAIGHAKNLCAALFRQGVLKLGAKVGRPSRSPAHHHAPRLVVCVERNGTAAVIPGRSAPRACGRLGLQAAARQ